MCDAKAGELLISFHTSDPAAARLREELYRGTISHVRIIESLSQRVGMLGLPMRQGLQFEFYRLEVPIGQEAFKVNYIQFYYKHYVIDALVNGQMAMSHPNILTASNFHLQVVPNSLLWVSTASTPGNTFSFSPMHSNYKAMIGWSGNSILGKRVMVLDTGVNTTSSFNIVGKKNFVDSAHPDDIIDDNGHGSAIASVIQDLYPDVEFVIYKVADKDGRASEWDTLAALAAKNDADVVNISLAFGLPDRVCHQCGRESHSSRSAVFENMVYELDRASDGPLLVAAAGNAGLGELSFPARYDNIVAVEAINGAGHLSGYSNRATVDHEGNSHPNVFVLPGGEKVGSAPPSEYVGVSSQGTQYFGTSFAAAYASGLVAALWSLPQYSHKNRSDFLSHLRSQADSSLPGYSAATHGNGLMRYS